MTDIDKIRRFPYEQIKKWADGGHAVTLSPNELTVLLALCDEVVKLRAVADATARMRRLQRQVDMAADDDPICTDPAVNQAEDECDDALNALAQPQETD